MIASVTQLRERILAGHNLVVIAAILVLVTSFALISHSLHASVKSMEAEMLIFDADDNESADKKRTVQSTSVIGFLSLGAIGGLCCLFRTPVTRNFDSVLAVLLFAYIGWIIATGLWTSNFDLSKRKIVISVLVNLCVFGLSRHLTLNDTIAVVIGVTLTYVVVGFVVEVAIGTFQPLSRIYRFAGTVHPNEQSMYAALLVLSSWCYRPKTRWLFWGRIGLIAIGMVAIYLTKSRTTLGALLLGIIISEVMRAKPQHRMMYGIGTFVLLSVGGLVTTAIGAWGSVGQAAAMGRTQHVTSLTGRVPLWNELWRFVERKPLFGHGYGAFWDSNMVREMSETFFWEIMNSHSIYLDAILGLGFVGLAIYLSMLIFGLVMSGRFSSETHQPSYQFVFGLILFAMIHGLAESKFIEEGLGTFFLLLCLYRFARCTTEQQVVVDENGEAAVISDVRRGKPRYRRRTVRIEPSSLVRSHGS